MYNVNGNPEGDWDFFSKDFSSHTGMGDTTKVKLLTAKFESYAYYQFQLGLSDMARFDENGIETKNPVFPFEIIMKPTDDLRNKFPSTLDASSDYLIYEDQLPTIPANTILWEVYGRDKPT
jgi:hypothetical protein